MVNTHVSGNKKILIWLLTGCFLIFAMVLIGGITRLTGSGLSITQWKLIRGTLPPLNEEQWNEEFENYKKIPQYKEQNYHFTIHDFKSIYWWEYLHRLLGRITGIVFIIPFFYFLVTRQLSASLTKKLTVLFMLGALQGFLGWYMVKSGLINNIRVSHYRLAAHLFTAFITYGFSLWIMLGIMFPVKHAANTLTRTLQKVTSVILGLALLQIIYGAFVAGLKAGHIYTTFPKMGDQWMADAVAFAWKSDGFLSVFNNMASVQFIHRCIAWLLLFMIAGLWIYAAIKNKKSGMALLSSSQVKALNLLLTVLIVQFLLGMLTLMYSVPIMLGILHQVTAFFLLSCIIFLLHALIYKQQNDFLNRNSIHLN